ncbi:MAG: rRNA pseudouridine synthase [Candidatus Kapabacteria bacterium]|nr:rRNA pseudouridine synthase [Candidatus Kapabacteria bacterium]
MRKAAPKLTHKTRGGKPLKNRSAAKYSGKDMDSVRQRREDREANAAEKRRKPSSQYIRKAKQRTIARLSDPDAGIRLNKFLADAGIASRRASDELIASGVVKVNGVVVKEQGTKVHPADLVTVEGEPVTYIKHLTYILLNKPKDYITTTNDEKGRKTVMDLIPLTQRLYPVGRLDRNTTGALLITNDGDLATRLMHPSYEVIREYIAGLDKKLKPSDAKKIANGVELEDGMTGEAELFINPDDQTEVRIILKEGRNREVRRIFEHLGYEVKRLHRMRYGTMTVAGISRGEYRHLDKAEVRQLRALVKLKSSKYDDIE